MLDGTGSNYSSHSIWLFCDHVQWNVGRSVKKDLGCISFTTSLVLHVYMVQPC